MTGLSDTGVILLWLLGVAVIIGFVFLVLAYLVANNKVKAPFDKPSKVIGGAVSIVLFALLGIGMAVGLYEKADKGGWFAHERTLAVEMPRDWLVGEPKACILGGNLNASVLTCEPGALPHEMNVEFRGSLGSLESGTASTWVCQRTQGPIMCRRLISHTADKRAGSDYQP
jgi:hypothetical protein